MNPLFTVLCSCRNQSKYIEKCILSVINQDYDNWELIIADDYSKDNTYHLAKNIADQYENIHLVKNGYRMHCGMSYDNILQLAKGEYCGVLDGDDTLDKKAISTIVKYYQMNPNIDFIWTKHRWYNEEMTKSRSGISSKPRGTIFGTEKNFSHCYSHWRTFKTSLKNKGILFGDLKYAVDKNLGYSLEELGRGGFLPIELYNYRYHKTNMSHTDALNQKATWKVILRQHRKNHRFDSVCLKVIE